MACDISIVVPLWNEKDNVIPLTQQIVAAFPGHALEVILVDDHSSDGTWEHIQNLCRKDDRIRGIRHTRNSGQSAALWTGFRASRGSVIGTLDGDLQNDPADLPRMLAELGGVDMVCGVRAKRMDNWVRRVSSKIARGARRSLLGSDFKDTGCNLRIFKRHVIDVVPAFSGFHRFMPVFVHGCGMTVKETPVLHHPRATGQSKYGVWNRLWRGLYDLMMVRWFLKRQIKVIPLEQAAGVSKGADQRLQAK